MKQLSIPIFILFIIASCSSNEEPHYHIFMQPSSIKSLDTSGNNQTFEYDGYGRIISWNCTLNSPNVLTSYSAHYSYPNENTIKVTAKELWLNQQRVFEETIQL
ncbi:MAG: hypothetical protein K2H60_03695, partial [Muribaculaceae bacterium]|nr:hypothetical protein [Muribaculaceae bacterium]